MCIAPLAVERQSRTILPSTVPCFTRLDKSGCQHDTPGPAILVVWYAPPATEVQGGGLTPTCMAVRRSKKRSRTVVVNCHNSCSCHRSVHRHALDPDGIYHSKVVQNSIGDGLRLSSIARLLHCASCGSRARHNLPIKCSRNTSCSNSVTANNP